MLRTLLRSCFLLAVFAHRAGGGEIVHGTLRHDRLWAPTLGVHKNMLVYLPPSYDTARTGTRRYPMAVFLHGRWGNETDWVVRGRLAAVADSLIARGLPEMIIAMPDGDDGWWTTWVTPPDTAACAREPHNEGRESSAEFCVPVARYDTYVAHDVVSFVDSTYRTLPHRESRAIGGLSMGGYGAFAIAARYPETFGMATSHGGVLGPGVMPDTNPVTRRVTWRAGRTEAELRKAVGESEWEVMYRQFGVDSSTWQPRDPVYMLRALKAQGRPVPLLYADAAVADERLTQNRVFRSAMQQSRIPLEYAEWPGMHDWPYWERHLADGLRFIAEHAVREPGPTLAQVDTKP
jgi:S-formylglutathione hydrolase FrmB